MDELSKLLRAVNFQFSNSSDLSGRVSKYTDLLQEFFNIRTVIDNSAADRIVRKALADHGLKLLTDEDLKIIQQRVGQQIPNKRVRLGHADFLASAPNSFAICSLKSLSRCLSWLRK